MKSKEKTREEIDSILSEAAYQQPTTEAWFWNMDVLFDWEQLTVI